MSNKRRALSSFFVGTLGFAGASVVLAAEQAPAQPYPGPWWHPMPWTPFWWIFPFMFFVLMIVILIFMMRRGGMGCMWRDRMMDRSEFRDAMTRSRGESSDTALEILNKRFARGEIDKQEYEEKKAVITGSD
jgi:uncharacterized membrane protein